MFFRDYFIKLKEALGKYGRLKRKLTETCVDDRNTYSEVKSFFIESILTEKK